MRLDSTKSAYFWTCAAGASAWLLTALLTRRSEAWDSSLYWSLAYPALALAVGWIAFKVPKGFWRWPLVAMYTQAMILFIGNPKGSLLPLGLVVFGVLALPLFVPAAIGARLARRAGTDAPSR